MCRTVILWSLLLAGLHKSNAQSDRGFLPECPGLDQPVHITDSYLAKNVFFVIQSHQQIMYRKRYYFHKAIDGIGKDPYIDFKNKKTMVFLDGYLDSSNWFAARIAAGQYLLNGTYNTITIDSSRLYSFIYPVASKINKQVGNITAVLLHGLAKYGLKAKDIELVGISMGGQTVGFVAKYYYELSRQKVSLLNSFDPSGPCFRNEPPEDRLSTLYADFVQVIHTNNEGFGVGSAVGHVDFYVNGGEFQGLIDGYQPWCDEFCSHVLSMVYYFTSFMYPDKFVGVKCKDVQQAREHKCYDNYPVETNVYGRNVDHSKPGIYYIPVSAEAPFFPPMDFIKKRTIYPYIYGDAFNSVDNIVLG